MEFLIQIIGEILFEIILTGIIKVISLFFVQVNADSIFRRNLKLALTYIFIGLIALLIVISIINSEKVLVTISLSYLFLNIVFSLLDIINKGDRNFITIFTKILKTISHYCFPILLIVYSSIYIANQSAVIILIIFSSVALLTFLIIDINRIVRHFKKNDNLKPTTNRNNQLFDDIEI